jgi:hypothetical protein
VPLFRRPGPPADARRVVEVQGAAGERAIAWGTDGRGDPVVVSTLALYLPTPSGGHQRLPFETIASAVWADDLLTVTVIGGGTGKHRVRLEEPGEIPPTVRERVTASIALSEHVDLAGAKGARITARRVPGRDELSWHVVFDPGLDPGDPELRARAETAIAGLRSSTGL